MVQSTLCAEPAYIRRLYASRLYSEPRLYTEPLISRAAYAVSHGERLMVSRL
jgi:hypothetical protein